MGQVRALARRLVWKVASLVVRASGPIAGRPLRVLLRHSYRRALTSKNVAERQPHLERARRWRQYVYPPGGRVMAVAQLDHNLRLEVNLCERGGSDLYFGVPFEPDEQVIVTQLVRSGSIVFDVGANMGLFSILASRAAGENGMVHAFEPATFAYQALQRNLRLNRVANVVANRVAVGERAGKVTLNVNLESGLSSLGQTGRGRVIAVEEVDCVSLDEYAEHRGIEKVDFLKVDVEGFDGHVLRGARRLIERSAELVVLCELAEKNFRPLGYSVTQVLSWMRERGFAVWQVDTELHQVVTVDGGRLADQNNYLFIRRPSAALRALRDAVAKGHLTTSARDTIEVE